MKKNKVFSIIAIISSLMMFVLAGCGSSDKSKVIDALNKTQNIKSSAFEGKVDFSVEGAEAGAYPIDKISFELNGKSTQEKNKNTKLEMGLKTSISGISMETKLFEELIFEKDKINMNLMIQIPEFFKAQLAPVLGDVDYLSMDTKSLEELQKLSNQGQAVTKTDATTANITEYQEKINKEITSYFEKEGDKCIENKGSQELTINKEKQKVDIYNIKMTKEEITNIMNIVIAANDKELKGEEAKSFKEGLDELTKMLDATGTSMEIGIKDGYIVHTKVNIALKDQGEKAKISVVTNLFDINKKMDIKIPTNKEVKSKNLLEILTMLMLGNQ